MNKLIALLLAGAMLAPTPLWSGRDGGGEKVPPSFAQLEPVTLVAGDVYPISSPPYHFQTLFAETVQSLTQGKLTIAYYSDGQLGTESDLVDLVGMGVNSPVSLILTTPASAAAAVPQLAVFDLPMAFSRSQSDAIDKVLNGASPFRAQLDAAYQAKGLRLLGFLQDGTYRVTTSNVPLSAPADFAQLRLRTTENPHSIAFWTAMGAVPVYMSVSELFTALYQQAVDAQENTAALSASLGLYEAQQYLSCTNHLLECYQVCISADVYNALDPLYQQALDQAAAQALQQARDSLRRLDEQGKARMTQAGMTLLEYDGAFFDQVLALPGVQALYASIDAASNGLAATLLRDLSAP